MICPLVRVLASGKLQFNFPPETTWDIPHPRWQSFIYTLFHRQRFFSTQPQCCFTFSWIELQMLLRCCLRHKSIIIPRHFLCLLYLSPCLELDLFMLYLCDLFFIFTFNFITINHTGIHVWYFLEYVLLFLDDNMDEECW